MDAENWRRAEEIFLDAVELPPDDREAFIVSACGDDAALAAEVRSLIASDANVDEGAIKAAVKDAATEVGKLIAERAIAAGVKEVVFDRGGFLFHGRIKALAVTSPKRATALPNVPTVACCNNASGSCRRACKIISLGFWSGGG